MFFNFGMDPKLNSDYNDQYINQEYYQPQANYVGSAPCDSKAKINK